MNTLEVNQQLAKGDAIKRGGLPKMFLAKAPVHRLFIDEITAVKDWQHALKALPFTEFRRVCATALPAAHLLPAYLIAGGSPPACATVAATGCLPDYIIEMVRDWIYGEFAASRFETNQVVGMTLEDFLFGGSPR